MSDKITASIYLNTEETSIEDAETKITKIKDRLIDFPELKIISTITIQQVAILLIFAMIFIQGCSFTFEGKEIKMDAKPAMEYKLTNIALGKQLDPLISIPIKSE